MRMLVLGFTGFLGGHVVEYLRTLPDVRALGAGRSEGAEFDLGLAGDSVKRLAKTLEAAAPDAVINCAGATGGDAVTLAEVDSRGPEALCAAMRIAALLRAAAGDRSAVLPLGDLSAYCASWTPGTWHGPPLSR